MQCVSYITWNCPYDKECKLNNIHFIYAILNCWSTSKLIAENVSGMQFGLQQF